jgi:hypothetical protein
LLRIASSSGGPVSSRGQAWTAIGRGNIPQSDAIDIGSIRAFYQLRFWTDVPALAQRMGTLLRS